MRAKLPVILAGAAAAILAAAATPATAGSDDTHILTVRLPNGMVEQIQYTGDVAPRIVVSPVPVPVLAAVPMFDPAPEWATPFAALARISALLDRQEAAMLQQAAQGPGKAGAMPPGFTGFSMVSHHHQRRILPAKHAGDVFRRRCPAADGVEEFGELRRAAERAGAGAAWSLCATPLARHRRRPR